MPKCGFIPLLYQHGKKLINSENISHSRWHLHRLLSIYNCKPRCLVTLSNSYNCMLHDSSMKLKMYPDSNSLQHKDFCVRSFKSMNSSDHSGSVDLTYVSEQKKLKLKNDIEQTKVKVKEKLDEMIEREKIYTIPNLLCMGRIVLSPFLCSTVLYENYSLALGLLVTAGFTDLIDGMIARKFPSQASRLGSILDPLADKILIASLFGTLTYIGLIPLPLTCLIISRDAMIVAGASFVRYKSLPRPFTLTRYFDPSLATVQLAPTTISKVNTAVQIGLMTASLAAPVFGFVDHQVMHWFWLLTTFTTISSGFSYIVMNDTYRILKSPKTKK